MVCFPLQNLSWKCDLLNEITARTLRLVILVVQAASYEPLHFNNFFNNRDVISFPKNTNQVNS